MIEEMKMRKFKGLSLALAMALVLVSFSGVQAAPANKTELRVFAAASMTETLNQVIKLYARVAPNVTIVPTFDSSGTLKTQIQEGAECDLFISAAQKQMNQLDGACKADKHKNPAGLDLIDSRSRVNILENRVVLVVPSGNPARIRSFKDIAKARLIALGNSDVPVGSYSLEIIKSLGFDIKQLEKAGKVTYGSNVKEVTTQVCEGVVDCGIVYATDAFSAKLTVVDTAKPDMCRQVVYPAAVLKSSKNAQAAKAFLDYLGSPAATAVFKRVGFSRP